MTVVGLHRKGRTTSLVRGEDLTTERLQEEYDHCMLLLTCSDPSSTFLVPSFLNSDSNVALRPLFCRLALHGGLTHIEQAMGIDRHPTISALDGLDAVRLWFEWRRGDTTARETLSSHNRAETENLVLLAGRFYEYLVFRFGPPGFPTTLQPSFCQ